MRIVAIADLHGLMMQDIPKCDVLIIAGDICPTTNHIPAWQANWIDLAFKPWLQKQPGDRKIVIAGNHDWVFYNGRNMLPELDFDYLENEEVVIDGVKFWGCPWTPWFFDWAFNFPKGVKGAEKAIAMWDRIPEDTDVLITHGPPFGHGDSVHPPRSKQVASVGCPYLLNRLEVVKPKVHVFGHIHKGETVPEPDVVSEIKYKDGSKTACYNVSVLNEEYRLLGKATVIDL